MAAWQERWQGLRQWFVSEPGHPSQAKLLRSRARQAIPDLLAVVATPQRASLRTLRSLGRLPRAGAVVRRGARRRRPAPAVAQRVRTVRLAPSGARRRHAHRPRGAARCRRPRPGARLRPCTSARACGAPAATSVAAAPTGSPTARRAVACWRSSPRRQSEQTAAARARLATGRPTKLGELGELDPDAFGLFLSLLGDALAARRPDRREVATTTVDGTLGVRSVALADAAPVEIHTPAGIFRGPRPRDRDRRPQPSRERLECSHA